MGLFRGLFKHKEDIQEDIGLDKSTKIDEEELGESTEIDEEELGESTEIDEEELIDETEEKNDVKTTDKDVQYDDDEDILEKFDTSNNVFGRSGGGALKISKEQKELNYKIDELIEFFTRIEPEHINLLDRGVISREVFMQRISDHLENKMGVSDKKARKEILKGFYSFIWSYDILDELIADDSISDIKVLRYDLIRIKVKGKRKTSELKFRSEDHYRKFVEHVAIKNKISISEQNAMQNFVDKNSSPHCIMRFNITTKFINSTEGPYVHIRKIPKKKYSFEGLQEVGMFGPKTSAKLQEMAANGTGILFTGKGASGKTTLMNVMLEHIPHDYSVCVIQENEELFTDSHPDMMFQHTVENRGEGKIQYTLKELARNGLLTDLDYFIIGEIKGDEALYLLNAAYTGHRCWASVHGASSTEAFNKLADYVKYASDYSMEEILKMLIHIEYVVFLERFKVKQISRITGWDEEKGDVIYEEIEVD